MYVYRVYVYVCTEIPTIPSFAAASSVVLERSFPSWSRTGVPRSYPLQGSLPGWRCDGFAQCRPEGSQQASSCPDARPAEEEDRKLPPSRGISNFGGLQKVRGQHASASSPWSCHADVSSHSKDLRLGLRTRRPHASSSPMSNGQSLGRGPMPASLLAACAVPGRRKTCEARGQRWIFLKRFGGPMTTLIALIHWTGPGPSWLDQNPVRRRRETLWSSGRKKRGEPGRT